MVRSPPSRRTTAAGSPTPAPHAHSFGRFAHPPDESTGKILQAAGAVPAAPSKIQFGTFRPDGVLAKPNSSEDKRWAEVVTTPKSGGVNPTGLHASQEARTGGSDRAQGGETGRNFPQGLVGGGSRENGSMGWSAPNVGVHGQRTQNQVNAGQRNYAPNRPNMGSRQENRVGGNAVGQTVGGHTPPKVIQATPPAGESSNNGYGSWAYVATGRQSAPIRVPYTTEAAGEVESGHESSSPQPPTPPANYSNGHGMGSGPGMFHGNHRGGNFGVHHHRGGSGGSGVQMHVPAHPQTGHMQNPSRNFADYPPLPYQAMHPDPYWGGGGIGGPGGHMHYNPYVHHPQHYNVPQMYPQQHPGHGYPPPGMHPQQNGGQMQPTRPPMATGKLNASAREFLPQGHSTGVYDNGTQVPPVKTGPAKSGVTRSGSPKANGLAKVKTGNAVPESPSKGKKGGRRKPGSPKQGSNGVNAVNSPTGSGSSSGGSGSVKIIKAGKGPVNSPTGREAYLRIKTGIESGSPKVHATNESRANNIMAESSEKGYIKSERGTDMVGSPKPRLAGSPMKKGVGKTVTQNTVNESPKSKGISAVNATPSMSKPGAQTGKVNKQGIGGPQRPVLASTSVQQKSQGNMPGSPGKKGRSKVKTGRATPSSPKKAVAKEVKPAAPPANRAPVAENGNATGPSPRPQPGNAAMEDTLPRSAPKQRSEPKVVAARPSSIHADVVTAGGMPPVQNNVATEFARAPVHVPTSPASATASSPATANGNLHSPSYGLRNSLGAGPSCNGNQEASGSSWMGGIFLGPVEPQPVFNAMTGLCRDTVGTERTRYWEQGIRNLGNTCFLGSAMQLLLGSGHFCWLLKNLGMVKHVLNPAVLPTLVALGELALKLTERKITEASNGKKAAVFKYRNLPPIIPTMLSPILQGFHRRFSRQEGRAEEQDAQEFLLYLLEEIEREILIVKEEFQGSTDKQNTQDLEDDDDGWFVAGRKNKASVRRTTGSTQTSILTAIFGGTIQSQVKAPDMVPSVTSHRFTALDLDIAQEQVTSVDQALELYTAPDVISDYRVEGTNRRTRATKANVLAELPPVLLVSLKRYTFTAKGMEKLQKRVSFGRFLKIQRKHMANGGMGGDYRLVATCSHHGRGHGGDHYTAKVLQPAGGWVHFDDSTYRPVEGHEVGNDTPYLMLYQKVEPVPPRGG